MGKPKALMALHGEPAIAWLAGLLGRVCVPVIAVVSDDDSPEAGVARSVLARTVVNPWIDGGMLASAQVGAAAALDAGAEGAVLLPTDVPLASEAPIAALIARWRETRCGICVPVYEGQSGHPTWFDREHLQMLRAASPGVETLRDVVRRARWVDTVEVDAPEILLNLNTPRDYARWVESSS
jgi:molybdenum cofactor cytidylyltransferase